MKKIIFPIILSVCSQLMIAQTTLTLDQCRKHALDHNKELKQSSLKLKEIKANQKAARTAYLPSVEASANFTHLKDVDITKSVKYLPTAASIEDAMNEIYNGVTVIPEINLDIKDLTALYGGLSVMQPIYAGGKIRNMNKQADAGVEMAEYGVSLKHDDVIKQTDNAFWTLATIQSNRKMAQKYIEMLSELEEKLTLMYETGLIPASEKLKVSVQKNDAELQLLKADNGIKIAKMFLNQILGQDLNTDISIEYDEKDISINNSMNISSALSNRKELKVLEKKVELSKLDKKMEHADYLPEFGVGLNYNGFYINDVTDNVNFKPMLAAKLTVPIFNWGQSRKKQEAANYKIEQAEIKLSQSSELLSLEIQQAYIKQEEAWEAINIAKKNITQAQESLEETQASFDVGLNTTSDLLNAQAQWLKANTQLFSAYAQYRIQQTEVERVTGKL